MANHPLPQRSISVYRSGLKLLPFLCLGGAVFVFNSQTDLNYMFRGYFTLLELQLGIAILYFLRGKIARIGKVNN